MGWIEQGDADMGRGGFGDDSLVCGFVRRVSPEGRPGECAGLFEVVGVSAKGGVEVFSDHEAGFYGMVVVAGLDDRVNLLIGVFVFMDIDDLYVPAKVIVYCDTVGLDCLEDLGVVLVLRREDDEEVWVVCFRGGFGDHSLVGVGGDVGELTDEQKGKDA